MTDPRRLLHSLLPPPVAARHMEYSLIMSADDDCATCNDRLIEISLSAIRHAAETDLREISSRLSHGPFFPDIWPGEHYRLLAGLVRALSPRTIVEIGTASGMSALALAKHLPASGRLVTFDLIPWSSYPERCLVEQDLASGKIQQILGDLSIPAVFEAHRPLFEQADLIFVDGPKDGVFEERFIQLLSSISVSPSTLVVFDDIRLWNMLRAWRQIARPKLDLTSFGHWSGTGLVDWGAAWQMK